MSRQTHPAGREPGSAAERPRHGALSPRARKFIGTVAMIALVLGWALGAMGLAQGRVTVLPGWGQFLAYLVLGLGWVLPAGLLVRWMVKDDVRPETL